MAFGKSIGVSPAVRNTSSVGADDASQPVKVALLLPAKASMRLLRRASELAAALAASRTSGGQEVEITVGLAEPDEERWRQGERTIRARAPGTIVRHLSWTSVPVGNARRMYYDLDPAIDLEGIDSVVVPRDWGWNFKDCAFWISLTDASSGPILPLRPIVYYCTGLPERYVPELVASSIHDPYWIQQAETFRMWRQALVVTSDPTTMPDLVSYAGVRRERTELIPDVLANLPAVKMVPEEVRRRDRIVWALRNDASDDLATCLNALQIYRREGGVLDIVVAVEDRHHGDERTTVAQLPQDLEELGDGLERVRYRSLAELDRLLVRSGGLWSSQVAGGAGEHLIDAQRAGLHFMGPAVPLNRHLLEAHGVDARLYPIGDVLGITEALHELEQAVKTPVAPSVAADPHSGEEFAALFDWLMATTRVR